MTTNRLLLVLVAVKLVVIALDSTIRVYLGDSAAYLVGALRSDHLPDDRSFTYSFVIRGLVAPSGHLLTLLFWQSAAGVITALLLWRILTRLMLVPRPLAFAAAVAFAIEPAQLYYERMVLAESFGLLAFAAFVAAAGWYVHSGRPWWLPGIALLGLAAASLRLNYLPVVLVISVAVPLCRAWTHVPPPWRTVAVHLLVAAASVTATHLTYRAWVGAIFQVPPTYLARGGFMRLGLVTPLLTPEHFERAGLPRDYPQRLHYPLHDRDARLRHMWSPGGLVRTLRQDGRAVEPIAQDLSRMALADDPVGLVRLGLLTITDYFREETIAHALDNDLGRREIPHDVLWSLREEWNYDARGLPTRVTAVSRYFVAGTWWLVGSLLLLAPLSAAAIVAAWRTPLRAQVLLAGVIAIGMVLAHLLFVNVAFYRYLHPLPFMVGLTVLPLVSARRLAGEAGTP